MMKFKDIANDASFHEVGFSAGGVPIEALRIGNGPIDVLIIGGVHGDEIEGIEFARALIDPLKEKPDWQPRSRSHAIWS